MNPDDVQFEQQMRHQLALFATPDYTVKGDVVNFFKLHAERVIPLLEPLAAHGDTVAVEMLHVARQALQPQPRTRTFMENNPDLF